MKHILRFLSLFFLLASVPVAFARQGADALFMTATEEEDIAIEGALDGVFSISGTRHVRFSKGNLQYTTVGSHRCGDNSMRAGTWRFAENQYDMLGEANANASATYSDYIDLFGWGTSGWNGGAVAYNPYSTSTTSSDYYVAGQSLRNLTDSCAYADWGVYNAISNGGDTPALWRTLTNDEWRYIFLSRSGSTVCGTANARYCMAQVADVNGVIVFPDSYTHPSAAPTLQYINQNGNGAGYAKNVIDASEWTAMETAGAVFLPAAGSRRGTELESMGTHGYYWSSSYKDKSYVHHLYWYPSVVSPTNVQNRYLGFAVRLVHDVEDQCMGRATTGTDVRTVCNSLVWYDGITYTEDNTTATTTLRNVAGCDSIVTLNLTVTNEAPPVYATDEQTACGSYTWIDGNTYTESNSTATYMVMRSNGCDSIVTLNLTISEMATATDTKSACGSYTWIDGNTYTESNTTATDTLTAANGCDSIVTLNLTISDVATSTDTKSACGSYTWIDGITYTESNTTATDTLTAANGCDSIVTLNLTIS
ncbi:MAG: hypothetical protein IJR13_02295, partial [Bacteroidales bacterium]|nr:hypothetical protein [Bacteroidales bacterium]